MNMNDGDARDEPEVTRPSVIEGRRAWIEALGSVLMVPDTGMCLYSPDYAEWPLDDARVVDALTRWAISRRGLSMRMLARNFDFVQARAPRFVQWRIQFAHVVACQALEPQFPEPAEGVLGAVRGLMALRGGAQARRATWVEGAALHAEQGAFDAAWDLSEPAFAPTLAGL